MSSTSTAANWWNSTVQLGCVTAYHLDLTPHLAREAESLSWLDSREIARSRRFTSPGPRRRFILCRAALRSILCSKLECSNGQLTIGSSYYEKPFAILRGQPHPIGFNVSHSGNHGLIGLGEGGRVGVDIEELGPGRNPQLLVETAFTPAEQADLQPAHGVQKQRLIFRLWTIKEALIKAVGIGLSLDMSSFELPLSLRHKSPNAEFHFPQAPSIAWRVDTIENSRYLGAVAQELGPTPSHEKSVPVLRTPESKVT